MTDTPTKAARGSPVYYTGSGKTLALTRDGIALVENLAGHKKRQNYIASALGITPSQFKRLLEDKDSNNDVRLAYHRGFAEHEEHVRKLLLKHATKNVIAAIYYSKTQFGWKESEAQFDVKQDNRINITIPAPMGFGEMLHAHGQRGVADFRKHKAVPLNEVMPRIMQDGKLVLPALDSPTPTTPEGDKNE